MATEHTGAMIALVPAEADAARLAMDGGEPVEDLHLTLTYLGDAADWDQAERLELAAKVALAAGGREPVEGDAFHLAFFNPGGEEPALVYGIGGEGVEWMQRQLDGVARMLFGSKVPEPHRPFAAHVTAAYTKDLDAHRRLVGNLGAVTFDRVRLAFGGEVIDIRLEQQAGEAPVGGGEFQFGVGPADDLLGDAQGVGETLDQDLAPGQVLLGEVGDREPGVRVGEFVDDPVTVGQKTAQTQARLVDVDMPGLVAAMGVYAPIRWHGPLAPVGAPTGDKRIFAPGAIDQATFPQPLRWQERGMPGHGEAVVVGSILHAQETTWNGEPYIMGHGVFLNPDIIPEVTKAVHLVENGVSGPSVDLDSFTAGVGKYDGKDILVVVDARQRGATLVSIPAFADLRLTLEHPQDVEEDVEEPEGEEDLPEGSLEVQLEALVAGAADPGLEAWEAELAQFATTKTQGWQSAPIAPRSATFDADDAVKRIQAWAGIGTDDADEGKFRSLFLWAKPEQLDQDNVPLGSAGYRLPWGDIFDGKPYLVYHAVYAAAALLEGGHGGLPNIPDTDKAQLRNTITKIYARFAEAFDDVNVRASWDAREASSMEVQTFAVRTGGWSSLPVSIGEWDEGRARAALDAWSDGDMAKYARGFLWFDEENRENKTAYKLPIAMPVGGELTVFLRAVNNAEARLNQADIPAADKARILAVLNGIQARQKEPSSAGVETFATQAHDGIHPPRAAFAQRKLAGKTKWTVVPRDGYNEVYGHLASWDSCHMGLQIGNPGICVKPPRSKRGYRDFHVSTVLTAEGDVVEVGKMTIDTYHGSTRRGLTAAQVRAHYEHTGTEAAVGRVYEDQYGPAFFGVQVPDNDPALAQKIRRTPVSGHWHPVDGHLELVAALGVNRPAYPIVASATGEDLLIDHSTMILMDGEVQTGLIASAAFDTQEDQVTEDMTDGTGEDGDCGCGVTPDAGEDRAARIMGYQALPTHAELQARQARLAAHLEA